MSQFSRNIAFSLASQVGMMATGFLSTRFLFRGLGPESLGLIYFSATIGVVMTAALEMGLGITIVRQVAQTPQERRSDLNLLLGSSLTLYSLLAVGSALAIFIGTKEIATSWLRLETLRPDEAIMAIRILALSALIALPDIVFLSVLKGVQRLDVYSTSDLALQLVRTAAIALLVWMGFGLLGLSTCCAIFSVAQVGLHYGLCRVYAPWTDFGIRFDTTALLSHRKFAGGLLFLSLAALFYNQFERIVISRFLPIAQLGIYGIIATVAAKPTAITLAFCNSSMPAFSELNDGKDAGVRTELISRTHDALCYIMALGFTFLASLADPVLSFTMDDAAASGVFWPFLILLCGHYLNATLSVPYIGTLGRGKPFFAVASNIISIPIIIVALLYGVPRYGIYAAAASVLINNLIWICVSIVPMCNEIGLPLRSWLWGAARPALACIVFFGPVIALIRHRPHNAYSYAALLLSMMLGYGFESTRFMAALKVLRTRNAAQTPQPVMAETTSALGL